MQCLDSKDKLYEKIVVSRSLVLLSGKDKLGFLKGGIKEKLDPYLLPLKDAVDQVVGADAMAFDYLTATTVGSPENSKPSKPKIEIEPLQYIRGRNLKDVFFIVDEVQNLTLMEVKTIVSRIGEGSKIVLLGDVDQIDNPYLSKYTNGISQVIERFKDSKIAAHISLKDGVRSQLASEAAERL
jgi:PhoH-like ATPase